MKDLFKLLLWWCCSLCECILYLYMYNGIFFMEKYTFTTRFKFIDVTILSFPIRFSLTFRTEQIISFNNLLHELESLTKLNIYHAPSHKSIEFITDQQNHVSTSSSHPAF